jgi:hypothetical protein
MPASLKSESSYKIYGGILGMKNEEVDKISKPEENEDMDKARQQRRDFLLKAGTGGAAALVGGSLIPQQVTAQTRPVPMAPRAPAAFKKETFFDHSNPVTQAASKFTIDLRNFQLSGSGLVAVRNAIVAAAIDKVKQVGLATPMNVSGSFSLFSQFNDFAQFDMFNEFNQFLEFGDFGDFNEFSEGPGLVPAKEKFIVGKRTPLVYNR